MYVSFRQALMWIGLCPRFALAPHAQVQRLPLLRVILPPPLLNHLCRPCVPRHCFCLNFTAFLLPTRGNAGGRFPAGVDRRYPRKSVYPGVLDFYRELDLGANGPSEWPKGQVRIAFFFRR